MRASEHFDFAVLGSGFAGSVMAMVLRRQGHSVLLLERGAHPRFAIGESSTPFANLLLERLAARFDLPVLKELSEWGSWQAAHPRLAAGLKRGFTFYSHRAGRAVDWTDRGAQLLVAASPNDRVADTHWYRPDFDAFLAGQARQLGAVYRDRFETSLAEIPGGWRIEGGGESFTAGFVIDASGANGVVARARGIPDLGFPAMPKTRAIYAHFRDVPRLVPIDPGLPYPPEDAAVHHLLGHGWMWVLRFNNGLTSAGFALTGREPADWDSLLAKYPALAAQFAAAVPVTPFYRPDPLSFRRAAAAGDRFALLPSAAGFVDPLLSAGFALTLLGIVRLAEIFAGRDWPAALRQYEALTFAELDATADLIGALYAKLGSFPEFGALTLLYFAALSFTETCWRLGREHLAGGFLLTDNRAFSTARAALCTAARRGETISRDAVLRAIEPFDIAGLSRADRRNWHPVDPRDLLQNRAKLGATAQEIETLIRSLGGPA